MENLLSFTLHFTAIVIGVVMLAQGLSRKVDLLSLRNFFLLGFIIFQLTSAAVTLHNGIYVDFALGDPATTGLKYTAVAMIFLFLFFLAYRRGWLVLKLARRLPVGEAAPGAASMLTLAIAFLLVGMVFRLVLVYIPVVGVFTGMTGAGLVAVAGGMALWVWAPRLLNPVVGMIALAVVGLAMLTVLQHAFGRRDLLSVTLCCIWGAYHSYWKHLRPSAALVRLGALAMVGIVFLAAFTAVRSGGERERSAGEYVQLMQGSDIRSGVVDILSGQFAGLNSMWMIENFPERFEHDTLHSLVYFLVQPVPRAIWAGKPEALGRTAVAKGGAGRKKGRNYSIGPGIIGHIWVDNPFLALVPYAIGIGLLLRLLDEAVRLHPCNPFVVLPIGTALGQFIGLARGELGLFLFQGIMNIVLAWIMMLLVARTMAIFGWRMKADDTVGLDDGGWSEHADDDGVEDQSAGVADSGGDSADRDPASS